MIGMWMNAQPLGHYACLSPRCEEIYCYSALNSFSMLYCLFKTSSFFIAITFSQISCPLSNSCIAFIFHSSILLQCCPLGEEQSKYNRTNRHKKYIYIVILITVSYFGNGNQRLSFPGIAGNGNEK